MYIKGLWNKIRYGGFLKGFGSILNIAGECPKSVDEILKEVSDETKMSGHEVVFDDREALKRDCEVVMKKYEGL